MPLTEIFSPLGNDDDNISANPARLVNFYRERVTPGGRTRYTLKSVLGQELETDIGSASIRAMGRGNAKSWVVGNGTLYEMDSAGALTSRGSVADDADTTIDGNYTDVTVVSGGNYYLWNGTTISQPTTKTFSTVGSHCYVGGYTVITEEDGKRFQWSGLGDASTLNALHFASAERVDDNILRAVEFQGNLLVLCETSSEIWQISGTGETAFSYVTSNNIGLKSFNLLARFEDSLFFIGNDNRAYLYGQGAVSTAVVETSIFNSTPTHCFYYEDEGHKFCVLRFSDRPSWIFDITEFEWHERAEGAGLEYWRAVDCVRETGTWFVGNDAGEVLSLGRTNQDLAGPLYREATGRTIYNGDRFSVTRFELLGRVGDHDLESAQDFVLNIGGGKALEINTNVALGVASVAAGERAATVSLEESGDGGRTFCPPKDRSMGVNEEFDQRMVWRKRGQFRQYTPRIRLSEAADITLYADGIVEVA